MWYLYGYDGGEGGLHCEWHLNYGVWEVYTKHMGKKAEYYVDLPLEDTEAFAICVRSSSQAVTPRIFLEMILRFTQFPVEFRDVNGVNLLVTLQFPVHVWKVLLEGHQGYDWVQGLADA